MNSSIAGIHKWQHHNFTTAPSADESTATYWHDSQVFEKSCYILIGLVAVLGLLGNGLVFTTITLRPHMKNVINYYIRNLAVADSLILLISLPLAIVKVEFIYDWPLGKFVCEVIVPFNRHFYLRFRVDNCNNRYRETPCNRVLSLLYIVEVPKNCTGHHLGGVLLCLRPYLCWL